MAGIENFSTTAASNTAAAPNGWPEGMAASDVNNTARQLMADIRREWAQGTVIASASTADIGAATGGYVHISGTATITSFGTIAAGIRRRVVFDGALTLTHNATSLILPGAANITTAAGDCAEFVSEGSGNWRCTGYSRQPILYGLATQADQETGTSTSVLVPPGRQHYHPSAAKAEGYFDSSGVLARSWNITSVTKNAVGDFTVNTSVTFSAGSMNVLTSIVFQGSDTAATTLSAMIHTLTTTSARIQVRNANGTRTDPTNLAVAFFGDL